MARLAWALLCQRVLTDQKTNSVSYIEAVEAVRLPRLPHHLPAVVLGCLWIGTKDEEFEFQVQIVGPDSVVAGAMTADPQVLPTGTGLRTNVALTGTKVTAEGSYEVRVRQKTRGRWRTESAIPLVVEVEGESVESDDADDA